MLQELYGVSPQTFSIIFGANALGLVAMSQVNGRLVGRLSSRRLLAIGGLELLALRAAPRSAGQSRARGPTHDIMGAWRGGSLECCLLAAEAPRRHDGDGDA